MRALKDDEKVELLLSFLRDAQPAVRAKKSSSGSAPTFKAECPECHGEGVAGRWKLPCSRCGGDEGKKGRGWVYVDGYTGDDVGTVETAAVLRVRRVLCDSCGGDGVYGNGRRCLYCDGEGRLEVPEREDEKVDPGKEKDEQAAVIAGETRTAKQGWVSRGSFDELALSLEGLSQRQVALLVAVYVDRDTDRSELTSEDGTLLMAARAHVIRRMRELTGGRIRVPLDCAIWWRNQRNDALGKGRAANGFAQARRDARIRLEVESGRPVGTVAREVGLHWSTVSRIARRAS